MSRSAVHRSIPARSSYRTIVVRGASYDLSPEIAGDVASIVANECEIVREDVGPCLVMRDDASYSGSG